MICVFCVYEYVLLQGERLLLVKTTVGERILYDQNIVSQVSIL